MFFLYPKIKKVNGGGGGGGSGWGLYKSGAYLIFWPSKWAPSFGGGHLLESELQ